MTKLSTADKAVEVLRAIHKFIYSREVEVGDHVDIDDLIDGKTSFAEVMAAPKHMERGIVMHDGEDPVISFSGDSGPGSVTIHLGTMNEPFKDHTHAGAFGTVSEEKDFEAFVRGLYSHFDGNGLGFGVSMSEVVFEKNEKE